MMKKLKSILYVPNVDLTKKFFYHVMKKFLKINSFNDIPESFRTSSFNIFEKENF